MGEVEAIKGEKTLLGGLKGVTHKEFEAVKRTAAAVESMTAERDQALARAERADLRATAAEAKVESAYADANRQLQAKIREVEQDRPSMKAQMEIVQLRKENQTLKTENSSLREHGFTNYMDFYEFVVDTYEDMNYIEVMRCYSGHFERMTRGNYQRWEQGQRGLRPSQAQHHASTTKTTPDCCPACGSIDIKKSGKTLANTQRWACKDCGKKFV